jgi:hypothetical protein
LPAKRWWENFLGEELGDRRAPSPVAKAIAQQR